MNKRQLIVAWCIGIIVSGVIFFAPYKSIRFEKIPVYKDLTQEKSEVRVLPEAEPPKPGKLDFSDLLEVGNSVKPVGYRWGFIKVKQDVRLIPVYLFRIVLPLLIVGGLLIYTLRNKNK